MYMYKWYQKIKKSTTPWWYNNVHMCAYMYVQYAIESFGVTREYGRGSQKSGAGNEKQLATLHEPQKTIACHGKRSINYMY